MAEVPRISRNALVYRKINKKVAWSITYLKILQLYSRNISTFFYKYYDFFFYIMTKALIFCYSIATADLSKMPLHNYQ